MDEKLWWQKPLRVIQTNLQVKDTKRMDPAKIAREIAEMAANVLVINVGGIYAWYPSKVKYHHVNEYLPAQGDLLAEILHQCHQRNLRVVARFDFSKTDDFVFQERPQWFVRDGEKKPRIYGRDRMGDWSLLLSTCINGGYRNEEVALPVLDEVLDNYDIDGVFLNAPQYEECHCDGCRSKYRQAYGRELPDDPRDFAPDWASNCIRDNVGKLYRTIKAKRPDVPMILYYSPNSPTENLEDRYATADMVCTEAQDVLSRGWADIPPVWKPALNMKLGRRLEGRPAPFGIIHSCPGMDWRHTGLPPAEYLFWMSQIPASGGFLWHSVTGFADTISDKRLLRSIGCVDRMIERCEQEMEGAVSLSQTALLWNGLAPAQGWAEALFHEQLQFDVLDRYQLSPERLGRYRVAILPDGWPATEELAGLLERYVSSGGNLIVEGTSGAQLEPLQNLLGISGGITTSEPLAASYLRLERRCAALEAGFEETPLLAHRGAVAYCRPRPSTQTLATLVPPFAPLDAVGAPPERASILTPQTDLPLCTLRGLGAGQAMLLPFELSRLIREYKLPEHYRLLRNCVDTLLGGEKQLEMDAVPGLQAALYRNGDQLLLHLVNGIGQRPLAVTIPYRGLRFSLRLDDGDTVAAVRSAIAGAEVEYEVRERTLHGTLSVLGVWDMIAIDLKSAGEGR